MISLQPSSSDRFLRSASRPLTTIGIWTGLNQHSDGCGLRLYGATDQSPPTADPGTAFPQHRRRRVMHEAGSAAGRSAYVCIELGWIRGELSHRSPRHAFAHGSPPSWSRWLHSVRIAGCRDAKVVERQCLAVLPVGVVKFRDDARLFPSSARAPGLCHASARHVDQFEGPLRMLLVKGVAWYWRLRGSIPTARQSRQDVKGYEEAEKEGLQSLFPNQRVGRHVRTHLDVLA